MRTPQVAVVAAILGGTLLGATSAAVGVGLWRERGDTPAKAVSGVELPPASAPATATLEPASLTSAAPAPGAASVAGAVGLEDPVPPWLEGPPITTGAEADAAAIRCARGDAVECMRAGDAFEAGRARPPDDRLARLNRSAGARLFEVACRRRDAQACHSLSVLYTLGLGVVSNPVSAAGYRARTIEVCRGSAAAICARIPGGASK